MLVRLVLVVGAARLEVDVDVDVGGGFVLEFGFEAGPGDEEVLMEGRLLFVFDLEVGGILRSRGRKKRGWPGDDGRRSSSRGRAEARPRCGGSEINNVVDPSLVVVGGDGSGG